MTRLRQAFQAVWRRRGPILSMGIILGLSVWLMLMTTTKVDKTPGAPVFEMVIANRKVKIEQTIATGGGAQYRFLNGPDAGRTMSPGDFESYIQTTANDAGRPLLYQLANVSGAAQLAWVAIGLGGQVLFAGRMIVQWWVSEREGRSVIPPIFWYMSLGGAIVTSAYFIWRHDVVGLLGQSTGLVIYVRNIRLLRRAALS